VLTGFWVFSPFLTGDFFAGTLVEGVVGPLWIAAEAIGNWSKRLMIAKEIAKKDVMIKVAYPRDLKARWTRMSTLRRNGNRINRAMMGSKETETHS